jgi:hypothetical protein
MSYSDIILTFTYAPECDDLAHMWLDEKWESGGYISYRSLATAGIF